MQLSRHFSVEEANSLVTTLVRVFKVVRPLHAKLLVEAAKMKAGGHKPDISGRMVRAELPPEVAARQRHIRQLSMAIQQMLHEIAVFGVEIKSAEGLIDFPSHFEGRTVYLCWRWGEVELAWYHDVDGGYAGRKPITDAAQFTGDPMC